MKSAPGVPFTGSLRTMFCGTRRVYIPQPGLGVAGRSLVRFHAMFVYFVLDVWVDGELFFLTSRSIHVTLVMPWPRGVAAGVAERAAGDQARVCTHAFITGQYRELE